MFSSAKKKRKNDENVDQAFLASTPSTRKQKIVAKNRASSPNAKIMMNNVFMDRKRSLWQQHMEMLNQSTKEKMGRTTSDLETLYTACEHLRVQRDVEHLYHKPPGEVVAMGMDDCFQLGVAISADDEKLTEYPPTLSRNLPSNVVQVASGGLHSAALTEDGTIYTWGCNDDDALGRDGITDENLHDIKAISQDDMLPEDRGQIVSIIGGDSHTLFLSLHGNVYQVGMYKDVDSGKFRDLPPGQTKAKGSNKVPVRVKLPKKARYVASGFSWNAAILEDDSLVTWGMGHNGQLARSEDMGAPRIKNEEGKETYDLGKTWIGKEETVEEIDENGKKEVYQKYKYNEKLIAEKFLKPAPPRWATPGKKRVLSVACGELHILVAARDLNSVNTRVYSSGQNQYGQLGHGDQEQRHELTPITYFDDQQVSKVAAGTTHSLALSIRGDAVFAWGRADYGQLGLTDDMSKAGDFESLPKQVAFPRTLGDTRIKDIVAGPLLSFAVTDTNDVYSWGFNESGATGQKCHDGKDVLRPQKLNVLRKHGNNPCHVHHISGGGQHTLMVIQRFAAQGKN